MSKKAECMEQEIKYTKNLLPKQMKPFTEFHEFQVYVVVENVKTLDVGWCVCVCVCGVPSCAAGSLSRPFGKFGRVSV